CPEVRVDGSSSFIHITGVGGQIVNFFVDPNPGNFVRSGTIVINGLGYGVTQDGQFTNYDGTYNITFNFTETFICPGLPICAPPISGGGTFAATFKNGVLVGGAIDGTISDFGELVITASAGGA